MRRVAISELKAKLSEYLKAVRAGEEVIVTDRGKPVARLAPISGADDTESRLRGLFRAGLARQKRLLTRLGLRAGSLEVDRA